MLGGVPFATPIGAPFPCFGPCDTVELTLAVALRLAFEMNGGSKLAPCRLAPVKLALVRFAPRKLAPDTFVVWPGVEKFAFVRLAPSKMAPCKLAPAKLAPTRFCPAKL